MVNEDTGPFCLFRLLLLLLDGSVDMNAPIIPFETYSVCKGMREVVLSNLGMWCRADDMFDIPLVEYVDMVQYGYCIFGGKGVHNSFIVYPHVKYHNHSDHLTIDDSTVNTLWSFSYQHPSFLHLSPLYNHRVFT